MRVLRNQRGDTIIEVLIAIAIVGSILGISFAIANRSLMAGRQAQERTEAVKLAESQVEKIKGYFTLKADSAQILPNDKLLFCMQPDRLDPYLVGGFDATYYPEPNAFTPIALPGGGPGYVAATHDINSFSAITAFPDHCKTGPDNRYKVALFRVNGLLSVIVRWDRAGGNGQDQVILVYRING